MKRINIGILGSGTIGCDTLVKAKRSAVLTPCIMAGRRKDSEGLRFAHTMDVTTSYEGVDALLEYAPKLDVVFDVTCAADHLRHAALLKEAGIKVINLTPAMPHFECVPAINLHQSLEYDHISMATCGGQVAAAIGYALSQAHSDIEYIEAVSSISAKSAGSATRDNIDEYLHETEHVIQKFAHCAQVKAILNINPAEPCIDMHTTIYALIEKPDLDQIKVHVDKIIKKVQAYVPGYQLIGAPIIDQGRITILIKTRGAGHYLPAYAGNLDIITGAAIHVAEYHAQYVSGAVDVIASV